MKNNNPFNLMFGKAPYSIIERYSQYQEIINTFNMNNPTTYAYIITGIRGSGKTVLLRKIAEELRQRKEWIVIDGNSQDELIGPLSEKLIFEGKKSKLFLDWTLNISSKFISLEIKNESKITNTEIIFEQLLKKANANKKKVLITIDEVSLTNNMKKFANFYQSMIGKNYDLFLLMTGLNHNINALISSDSSSFLSRTPKIELLPLDEVEIAKEYQKILNVSFIQAAAFSKLTSGYAFAYQVLGFLLYESDKKEVNDELLFKYDSYLRNNGYNVIWSDLTNMEKNVCIAIAKNEDGQAKDIAKSLNMTESNYQNYRSRLIKKNIIKRNGYGKLVFVLPRFKNFVQLIEYFN